jgi:hypothetical protein
MQALQFWKTVTVDKSNLLERLIAVLSGHSIRYCVIGGVGVNAYVEPVVTLDLDLVVAVEQIAQVEALLAQSFQLKRFEHSLNVSLPDSKLRVQIQTDARYADFVKRATPREVLELVLPVASLEDLIQAKIWASQDPTRRKTKQQKDLLDIARLLEAYPQLRSQVPADILKKIE